MQYLTIDYIIVYAFLAITLFIGFQAGKGIKDIQEYAIANKIYGTITLTLTSLATNIGAGSVMEASAEVFSGGIIRSLSAFGVAISLLFIAIAIAPRIIHFHNCLTLGDVMNILYGTLSK